jgi:hypothetical protein
MMTATTHPSSQLAVEVLDARSLLSAFGAPGVGAAVGHGHAKVMEVHG